MADTVAQMTKEEFREMMEDLIEQKLLELLGDADEGLQVRKSLQVRLVQQRKAVETGERGELFDDVLRRLELG